MDCVLFRGSESSGRARPLTNHIACNCLIMLTILSDSRVYRKPFYVGKQVMYDKKKVVVTATTTASIEQYPMLQFNRWNGISNGVLRHSLYR